MSEALYLNDCYLKEFTATVESIKEDKFVVLDKTAFYPNAGGQPHDTGKIIRESDNKEFPVAYVAKFGDDISHEVSVQGLKKGDMIKGIIDWERRYTHMKMHTAAHILSRILFIVAGANTSGNQLGVEKSRIDFTLDTLDRDKIQGWFDKVNLIISKNIPVKIEEISREEAKKTFTGPSLHLMANIPILRVINIDEIDVQSCGGTHLKNTGEIGKIELVKCTNKGKNNRRIYYKLAEN
jgi:misacylated tRNA(Ala) deacylase